MITVTGKRIVEIIRNIKSRGERRSAWRMLDRVDKTFISKFVQEKVKIRHRGTWLAGREASGVDEVCSSRQASPEATLTLKLR